MLADMYDMCNANAYPKTNDRFTLELQGTIHKLEYSSNTAPSMEE